MKVLKKSICVLRSQINVKIIVKKLFFCNENHDIFNFLLNIIEIFL